LRRLSTSSPQAGRVRLGIDLGSGVSAAEEHGRSQVEQRGEATAHRRLVCMASRYKRSWSSRFE
jgi:hypothetical protein